MTDLQINSISKLLTAFVKKLTHTQFISLVRYICYECKNTSIKPEAYINEFIDDFFGLELWNKIMSDERSETKKMFFSASMTERELIRHIRIALMQESFFKLTDIIETPPIKSEAKPFISREEGAKVRAAVKPKEDKLSSKDRELLHDILKEHKLMLLYQLEDEESVKKAGGQELLDEKKTHLRFINNLNTLKVIL